MTHQEDRRQPAAPYPSGHQLVPRGAHIGAGYEELIAGAPENAFSDEVDDSTLAGLFYTGGTTGASKGVMLTHRNLVANALHFQVAWPFGPETCWLIVAPLFHAAGSIAVLATVWHGGRQVVLPAFDPDAVLDLVERHGVTATLVVPTMLAALADEQIARPRDVSSLRAHQPRRRAGGDGDAAPRARGVPRRRADAHLRARPRRRRSPRCCRTSSACSTRRRRARAGSRRSASRSIVVDDGRRRCRDRRRSARW